LAGDELEVVAGRGAACNQRGLALTRARAYLDPEILSPDLDRALDHPNQVGVHAVGPITRQLAETEGRSTLPHQVRRYPIRKVTTPVPVEAGVAGGALP
jgi:hypothetical protein